MHTEYEVRILEIDVEQFKQKLSVLKAEFVGHFFQRRYVYDVKPKKEGKWIRLRTTGDKTTLAIKDITTDKIDGTKELEIKVDDFEKTHLLLQELGYSSKGFQENKRIRYMLDEVELDIDTWPGIPTYVELEGRNEEVIHRVVEKLGFTMEDTTTMDVESIYIHYGYQREDLETLKFEEETV